MELEIRELTNRRLSHDGVVGSPYSPASSSCRNFNLRFRVKTTTLFKPKCLTSEKREVVSHTVMGATL